MAGCIVIVKIQTKRGKPTCLSVVCRRCWRIACRGRRYPILKYVCVIFFENRKMQKLKDTRVIGLSSQIFKMRSKMNGLTNYCEMELRS